MCVGLSVSEISGMWNAECFGNEKVSNGKIDNGKFELKKPSLSSSIITQKVASLGGSHRWTGNVNMLMDWTCEHNYCFLLAWKPECQFDNLAKEVKIQTWLTLGFI